MSESNKKMYLFEAIELRNEYDRHIRVLENLSGVPESKTAHFFRGSNHVEEKEFADDFNEDQFKETLKKLQTKRIKLNQAIQIANFENQIVYNGKKISIAEGLEIRKNLIADLEAQSDRVKKAAYKRIIHKEERDIVHAHKRKFKTSYEKYLNDLDLYRKLVTQIHVINHMTVARYQEE